MKTLKQLREEYDNRVLNEMSHAPHNLMLEGVKKDDAPGFRNIPAMLLFKRVAYRLYPNKQIVALYYSKMVNKYLSIPFGPEGNLNLSESTVYDSIEDFELNEGAKWEAVKGGLKGAAHGAVRGAFRGSAIAAEPGMAIGAVAGAAHGAYKGAKAAYNKAKDQNMEEDWQSVNRKDKTDGLSQAAVNAYRREHPGSKLKTAVTEKNPSGKRASRRKSFCSRMGGMKKRLTSAKTARDPDSRINKALRRWNCEESFRAKLNEKRDERIDEFAPAVAGAIGGAARAVGGWALGKAVDFITGKKDADTGESDKKSKGENPKMVSTDPLRRARSKTSSSWSARPDNNPVLHSRIKAATEKDIQSSSNPRRQVAENKISDLRIMISEGNDSLNLSINGREVKLNNSMAKRILEVYDSVNTKNKKIVESMLNEDLESFKKLLNFSIKA